MEDSPERLQCLAMFVLSSAADLTLCGPEPTAVAASHGSDSCCTGASNVARGNKHHNCFSLTQFVCM